MDQQGAMQVNFHREYLSNKFAVAYYAKIDKYFNDKQYRIRGIHRALGQIISANELYMTCSTAVANKYLIYDNYT